MRYVLFVFVFVSFLFSGCGGGASTHYFSRLPDAENSIAGDGYNTPIHQDFIQAFEKAEYDILTVLDNSGSMSEEIGYVKSNMNYFVQTMGTRRLVEYQMAFINTDWRDLVKGHGKFRGPVPIIRYDHATPVTEAEAAIDDINYCAGTGTGCATSGDEQGLNAARQALMDNGASFIRSDANLVMIIVSDEEDHSCGPNGAGTACASPHTTVPVNTFVTYFKGVKPPGTGSVSLFPIVGIHLSDCSTIATVGSRYLATLTGLGLGGSGSICQSEFLNGVNRIANMIADNGLCFPLDFDPKRNTIRVFLNGVLQETGYSFDRQLNAACFDANHVPTNGDRIAVEYFRK